MCRNCTLQILQELVLPIQKLSLEYSHSLCKKWIYLADYPGWSSMLYQNLVIFQFVWGNPSCSMEHMAVYIKYMNGSKKDDSRHNLLNISNISGQYLTVSNFLGSSTQTERNHPDSLYIRWLPVQRTFYRRNDKVCRWSPLRLYTGWIGTFSWGNNHQL